ncbi:MAG: hypothetical protein AAF085_09365 [Planctomycetota bacterium]
MAIACLVSAGCTIREEVVSLGKPSKAYQADNGSVVLGYLVEPTPQVTLDPNPGASYAGWHWLIVEPDTAKLMLTPAPAGETGAGSRVVTVDYEGWGRNAELIPPLLKPGFTDSTPPAVGQGGLTPLAFTWDTALGGARLMSQGVVMLPLIKVAPGTATLRIREYNRELMLDILTIAAVAGLIAGLILLGGSSSIEIN